MEPPTSAVIRRVKGRLNTGQIVPAAVSMGGSGVVVKEDDRPPIYYLASLIQGGPTKLDHF